MDDVNESIDNALKTTASPEAGALKPDEYTKGLNQEHIKKLTQEAYKRLMDYTKAELKLTIDDCQLLEEMNKATKEKYTQMNQMSQHLTKEISKLQNTYEDFNHFIRQVEDIHEKSVQMEKTAKALDEYSQYLENKLLKLRPSTSIPHRGRDRI